MGAEGTKAPPPPRFMTKQVMQYGRDKKEKRSRSSTIQFCWSFEFVEKKISFAPDMYIKAVPN